METFPAGTLSPIRDLLSQPQKIIILTHFNPDGDALGSSLALKLFLESKGHSVKTLLPSDPPPYYKWMPSIDECEVYKDKLKESFENYFNSYNLIFCLDFNASSRVNGFSQMLAESDIPKVLIDHHEEPANEFHYVFSYPGTSSTCELVYDFILKIDGIGGINKSIGECLYTGLITDTGGFQFSSTHSSTHHMAAALIEIGIDPSVLFNNSFNNFSLNRLKLFGHCISENMKIFHEYNLAILWIDKKTKRQFDIKDGDTEGLVN